MFGFDDDRCVCVFPQCFHFSNLPAQTVSSLRRRLSSSWFMSLIKSSVCVCVCVAQGHTVPYNHSTSSLFTFNPPSLGDNSRECGCERFRSALVRPASLSEGTVVAATLLISELPWCSLKGKQERKEITRCIVWMEILASQDCLWPSWWLIRVWRTQQNHRQTDRNSTYSPVGAGYCKHRITTHNGKGLEPAGEHQPFALKVSGCFLNKYINVM